MSKRLFVGGLAWATTEEGLREAFKEYGVLECKVITHREGEHQGKSKGFGFVNVEQGDAALAEMDGAELDGRYIRVNEAHQQQGGPRETRGAGGGNGHSEGARTDEGHREREFSGDNRRRRREGPENDPY